MTAVPQRRRGRPRDEDSLTRRRADILEAAARLFAQQGYPGTEMQQLADVLDLGKGTLYRYFPSKEELFLAAVDDGMHRLTEAVDQSAEGVDDPLERIACMVRAYLAFFKDNAHYAELLIQERAEFRDRKQAAYFAHRDQHREKHLGMLRELIDSGRFRNIPIERITDVFSDLVYGSMFTNHFAGRHKPLDVQTEDILDVIFHGLLSDSERTQVRRRLASTEKEQA